MNTRNKANQGKKLLAELSKFDLDEATKILALIDSWSRRDIVLMRAELKKKQARQYAGRIDLPYITIRIRVKTDAVRTIIWNRYGHINGITLLIDSVETKERVRRLINSLRPNNYSE